MSIPIIDTVLFIRQTIVNTRNALQREDDRRTSLQEQGKEKVYSDISNDDGQINCHTYYPNSGLQTFTVKIPKIKSNVKRIARQLVAR